ncbi:cytochrome c3 family protein [Rhodoferax sp. U11-2br]|uniref:cytochrome c3 family protein n=1 Tax=Rhodoferax sp. U11-2br TaxID=2838878 RepID=UPI001BEBD7E4|nr:cytochrome c3 family protein [Rhodoferax sp. U11-2br]MBT3065505.1 cytochrome c family protein [Rhodoferax sp. U11-2br]
MSKLVKIILAVNLVILAALTFIYPNLMVGPGKLIPGHKALEGDCFACHTSFTGANSEKCATCHKPADIGRLSTLGVALVKPSTSTAFHQELQSQDCVACHSDHAGVKRFARQRQFDHSLLKKVTLEQCQSCHKAPTDMLHKQVSGNCLQCHSQTQWTPATFDHNKFFVLDRDHNAPCATCHVRNDYSRSTCYGCHEHTPDNIRREHIKEGISKYENCVECHRSGNKHDIKGGREGGSGRKGHQDDD